MQKICPVHASYMCVLCLMTLICMRSGVMLVTQFPLKNQPKLKSKDIKYQWMEKSLRTEPSLTWTV